MKRLLFILLTAGMTFVFGIVVWQDMTRDWMRTQHAFVKTLDPKERKLVKTGIQQILVHDFNRVDRCTTCHVAIDKPQIAMDKEPYKAHPGDYLKWHPVEKFGCTVCHGGQGLATQTADAHGDVPHWEEPLLRGDLVQASCASCHGNLQKIENHAPLLVQGKRLFTEKGCYGCHAIKDFGGQVSVELTEVGSKPYQLIHADFEMMPPPHDRIHWIQAKLASPRSLNPGVIPDKLPPGEEEVFPTHMPNFGLTDQERGALTVYLLSLRDFDPPSSYVDPAPPEPQPTYLTKVEEGRALFHKFGCVGCHNEEGVGGRHNWNAGLGEEVPSLLYVKVHYTEDELKDLLRRGRQPAYRGNVHRPVPPAYMPAWKDRLTEDQIDALVAYVYSLYDRVIQSEAAAEPPTQLSQSAEPSAVANP